MYSPNKNPNGLVANNWCEGGTVSWGDFNEEGTMDAFCYKGTDLVQDTQTPRTHDEL